VSVEVVVSDGEIAAPVAGRLYLPAHWTESAQRRADAGVPPEVKFQTKPQIAAALITEVLADGVAKAPVLGDEVYGAASELRRDLRHQEMEYMLNAGGDLLAWEQVVPTRRARKHWGFPLAPRRPVRWQISPRPCLPKPGTRWLGEAPMAKNATPASLG